MRARYFDLTEAKRARWIQASAVGAALFLLSLLATHFHVRGVLLLVGALGMLALFLLPYRSAKRGFAEGVLELHPGEVRIVSPDGVLQATLRASEIVAATTTLTRRGVGLALSRRASSSAYEPPALIEVGSAKEADALRTALGIGHHGFGELGWPIASPPLNIGLRLVRALCAAFAIATLGRAVLDPHAAFALFQPLAALGLLHFVKPLLGRSLWMRADGVHVFDGRAWRTLAFSDVEDARVTARSLEVFSAKPGAAGFVVPIRSFGVGSVGLTRPMAEHIAAQIRTAARRARGEGALEEMPSPAVEALAQRAGEGDLAWIARVDATASTLGSGYRGAGIGEEELWSALENADAQVSVRAAAARVLATSRGARVDATARLDAALAAVRDDGAKERIRVATLPAERAVAALATMDEDADEEGASTTSSEKLLHNARSH